MDILFVIAATPTTEMFDLFRGADQSCKQRTAIPFLVFSRVYDSSVIQISLLRSHPLEK
jgi:hypothetical protein